MTAQSKRHSTRRITNRQSRISTTKPMQKVFSMTAMLVWQQAAQRLRLLVQSPKPSPLEKLAMQKPASVAQLRIIHYIKMSNQIKVIVQGQACYVPRDLLAGESDSKELRVSKEVALSLPEWVTRQAFRLIQKYLRTKDVHFLNQYINETETIVKLLRTADYLGMVKFHEMYINEVLIPNINHTNCLALLEQSHKKLKNINDSQTWYNLLNMSIIYLSTHAFEVFKVAPLRFKKLNDKIITEVLERVIRLERKNGFPNKNILFKLVLDCKQAQIGEPAMLFQTLRNNLRTKKIHAKIHAKLSWKLESIPEMVEKNTKVFKYLDMNWFLRASRVEQGLLITLNLKPYDDLESISFKSSESSMSDLSKQSSQAAKQRRANDQKSETEDMYRNDSFTKIGVFYSKVHWKFNEQTFQQDIKTHHILLGQPSAIEVILVDKKMQNVIGNQKIELTIFCNTETIYTFMLNYVLWFFDSLSFRGPNFSREQLNILIKAHKKLGKYLQALRVVNQLLSCYPGEIKNVELSQGFDFPRMTKPELEIYSTLFNKKPASEPTFTKIKAVQIPKPTPISTIPVVPANSLRTGLQNTRSSHGSSQGASQKRTISPIPITPISSVNRRVNFSSTSGSQLSVSTQQQQQSMPGTPLNASEMEEKTQPLLKRISSGRESNMSANESLHNSRGDSRNGSKRKIFSRLVADQPIKQHPLLQQIAKVTDLSHYLNPDPASNPEYQQLSLLLKI